MAWLDLQGASQCQQYSTMYTAHKLTCLCPLTDSAFHGHPTPTTPIAPSVYFVARGTMMLQSPCSSDRSRPTLARSCRSAQSSVEELPLQSDCSITMTNGMTQSNHSQLLATSKNQPRTHSKNITHEIGCTDHLS